MGGVLISLNNVRTIIILLWTCQEYLPLTFTLVRVKREIKPKRSVLMVGYNRLFYRNQLGFKLLRVQLHRKFGANSEEINLSSG